MSASTLPDVDVLTGEAVSQSMDEGDVKVVGVPVNVDSCVEIIIACHLVRETWV